MERRSYHPNSEDFYNVQQFNDGDRRRSTWHPSQVIASTRQPSNESINVSPLKEYNIQRLQKSIPTSSQLGHQSITNQLLEQSTTRSNDFDIGQNDTIYKSSNVSIFGDSTKSPTTTELKNANSCELPILSTRNSTTTQSTRNSIASHQMDSSPYRSTHQSIVNQSIPQTRAIQSTKQSIKGFDQTNPQYGPLHQSIDIRSTRQSTTHEPLVEASNSNTQQLQRETWEDHTTQVQPAYALVHQAKDKQSPQQSTALQSTCQLMNSHSDRQLAMQNHNLDFKEFEDTNQPYEYRLNHQSIINNHLYKDDRQNFQNKLPHRLLRQSITNPTTQESMLEHSIQQSLNKPSTQQSMVGQSTRPSIIQSSDDDNHVFNSNIEIPHQLHQSMVHPKTQESTIEHHTRQSIANQSMRSFLNSPSRHQSENYKLNQPSLVTDEDINMTNYEILPEDVFRQQSSYGPNRQPISNCLSKPSMANRSTRQSAINESTRPSTIHGYNIDNQTWNDINQSNAISPKSNRQSMATKSIRPSTTDGCISYNKTLESDNEGPSYKVTQQSTINRIIRQSKANNPNSDVEIFEGDDASRIPGSYLVNRQSTNRQILTNPSIRQFTSTRPNRQSMGNRSVRQSTRDHSNRQSMLAKLSNQSNIEEYNPRVQPSYSHEPLFNPPIYNPGQQSIANQSAQQSTSNEFVQELGIGNFDFGTNGFEKKICFNQSPSKSTHQSTANRSLRQSHGNKSIGQPTMIKSVRPSTNDHQNGEIQMFDNQISHSQQSKANQYMQQSIEGLNIEGQTLEDKIHPKLNSIGEKFFQQSYAHSSNQPSNVTNSVHLVPTEAPSIELQTLDNDIQSIGQPILNQSSRLLQGNRSTRESMKIKPSRPSATDQQIPNIQMFEAEPSQNQQSKPRRSNQHSMANQFAQQSIESNSNLESQMLNNETYPSQISMEEKVGQQLQGNRYTQQSPRLRSAHQLKVANPNLDLHMLDDEPNLIQQSMENRSPPQSQRNRSIQQSQGNKSARQSIGGRSIRQLAIDDQNLELQISEDDIQLSRSPYMSSRQSMANKSHQLSSGERLTQQLNSNKFMQESTLQGMMSDTNYHNDENTIKKGPLRSIPQSTENMSSNQYIGEGPNYHNKMLENKVDMNDPLFRTSHQSINEVQASRKSSFDEHYQNQFNENEFSKLTSYSGDHFEPKNTTEESRLNSEPTQSRFTPSRFVTLEVRSNVQKESLDKFLVGGWDSVTLKIPPEMHSLLHGIRNSLTSDNPDLDLDHMASMAEGNDGQCSANIRILYSGIYNSNQEPTINDLYEQSQISHTHSGSDSSNCPSCNVEKEQGTVRFNIEG